MLLAIECTIGALANIITFGAGGGSISKVGGKLLNNMANNFTKTMMENTTRHVAGKVISKTTKGVIKNVVKNALYSFSETFVISGGALLHSKIWGSVVQ